MYNIENDSDLDDAEYEEFLSEDEDDMSDVQGKEAENAQFMENDDFAWSKDKTVKWMKEKFPCTKLGPENIIRTKPRPTPYARNTVKCPLDAFFLFYEQ